MTFYAVVEVCVIFNQTNTQREFDDKNRVKEVCAQNPGLNHAISNFTKDVYLLLASMALFKKV